MKTFRRAPTDWLYQFATQGDTPADDALSAAQELHRRGLAMLRLADRIIGTTCECDGCRLTAGIDLSAGPITVETASDDLLNKCLTTVTSLLHTTTESAQRDGLIEQRRLIIEEQRRRAQCAQ